MDINALVHINFDLLSVGIAVAGILLLGCVIFFNNRKSVTNRVFLYFALLTAVWGVSNYLEYRFTSAEATLWALRFHVFLSTLHALFFFTLAYVFPREEVTFPRWYRWGLVVLVGVTAVLTLSPFVFESVANIAPAGYVTRANPGPGIVLFIVVAFGCLLSGIGILLRRTLKATGIERRQELPFLIGMTLMAVLILAFNVVLPNAFANVSFIPLAALFVLPFVALTSYAIYRHHLFNLKVAATAFLGFMVTVFSFVNVIYSTTLSGVVVNVTAFVIILLGSIKIVRDTLNLQIANEQLSEFMSLATHEIRNPATFIKGFSADALEGDWGPLTAAVRDGMEKIYVRVNDIIELGNQYLDKSKLELNQLTYAFINADLGEVARALVSEFQAHAAQRGITLQAAVSADTQYLARIDIGKIKEVIGNLIDNAIKYTPKGSVTVSLEKANGKVLVKIADTGVGIPAETIPELFKKFSRADAQKVNLLGSGLGLYLAKIFVDAHHGTIRVESPGKDKGSTFYVELPAASPASQA